AERGEQAVADAEVVLGRRLAEVCPPLADTGDAAGVADITPKLQTGVEGEEVDVDGAGELGDDLQVDGRQGRDAEQAEPFGENGRVEDEAIAQKVVHQPRPVGRLTLRQRPPEPRLPVPLLRARLPLEKEFRSIDEVLIEYVGD